MLVLKKICIFCKKASYSSSSKNWLCPYCGKDITHIPNQNTEEKSPSKIINLFEKRKKPY